MKFSGSFFFLLLIFNCSIYSQDQQPRNIIILIGDGMGVNTVAASILSDQQTPFTQFNSVGFSVTTALDNLITDSAAGATAMATGHKTGNGIISLSPSGEKLKTLFEEAEDKGMSTGLVVTSSVTHATPAAFYAHTISRENEQEIADQLLETGTDVIIGAGQKFFFNSRWETNKSKLQENGFSVFTNADSLVNYKEKNKIFAILEKDALPQASKRNYSLAQLTEKALDVLKEDKDGFILLIEGSQIDWAEHENDQQYMFGELYDFTGAINTALNFALEDKNTLVIITADHETGGVTITGGDPSGKKLEVRFNSFYHTAGVVPVFAKGPSEELFRGVYQNHEIGKKLINLISKKPN